MAIAPTRATRKARAATDSGPRRGRSTSRAPAAVCEADPAMGSGRSSAQAQVSTAQRASRVAKPRSSASRCVSASIASGARPTPRTSASSPATPDSDAATRSAISGSACSANPPRESCSRRRPGSSASQGPYESSSSARRPPTSTTGISISDVLLPRGRKGKRVFGGYRRVPASSSNPRALSKGPVGDPVLHPPSWTATAAPLPHHIAWESDRSRISADARFVATGTPWMSQTFSSAWMSGSWGCAVSGSSGGRPRRRPPPPRSENRSRDRHPRPAVNPLDVELEDVRELPSGVTGREEAQVRKGRTVSSGETEQVVFLLVVRDEREHGSFRRVLALWDTHRCGHASRLRERSPKERASK